MKYFYFCVLILSLISISLENKTNLLNKCVNECYKLTNPTNRKRCHQNCYNKYYEE